MRWLLAQANAPSVGPALYQWCYRTDLEAWFQFDGQEWRRASGPYSVSVTRGPFESPPIKGARDLSRQADARRRDPARIEADRKQRELETQKLGRAIVITDRRGCP